MLSRFQEKVDKLLAKENFALDYRHNYATFRKFNNIEMHVYSDYIRFQDVTNKYELGNDLVIKYSEEKNLLLKLIPEIHKCKTFDHLKAKYENMKLEIMLDRVLWQKAT